MTYDIKKYRLREGMRKDILGVLNQSQVARIIGVSGQTISNCFGEKGTTIPVAYAILLARHKTIKDFDKYFELVQE